MWKNTSNAFLKSEYLGSQMYISTIPWFIHFNFMIFVKHLCNTNKIQRPLPRLSIFYQVSLPHRCVYLNGAILPYFRVEIAKTVNETKTKWVSTNQFELIIEGT